MKCLVMRKLSRCMYALDKSAVIMNMLYATDVAGIMALIGFVLVNRQTRPSGEKKTRSGSTIISNCVPKVVVDNHHPEQDEDKRYIREGS